MNDSRLSSEIWHVVSGPMLAPTRVHEEVLAQSPTLAAVMEHKRDGRNVLFLGPSAQDLQVFRRILEYLYSQELPVLTADKNERPKQQCEEYIMACRLELDVMQSLLLQALYEKEDGVNSEMSLAAVKLVYEADEAKMAFRDMFKRRLHKCINEEGLNTDNYASQFVKEVLASGGPIASDVGDVLMTLLEEKECNASRSKVVNDMKQQVFKKKSTELQMKSQEWESKVEGASVQVTRLKMMNERMRCEAKRSQAQVKELQLKNKEWMSRAVRTSGRIMDLEKDVESTQKQAYADALLMRMGKLAYATGYRQKKAAIASETNTEKPGKLVTVKESLPELKKEVNKADVLNPTSRPKWCAATATKSSGLQRAGDQNSLAGNVSEEDDSEEDDSEEDDSEEDDSEEDDSEHESDFVAIAGRPQLTTLKADLDFVKGDCIKNIVSDFPLSFSGHH
jgi:hypothetical protein